ncbi:ATPase, AAA family protein [Cardiosporidium cionae]|uniref:ATPase, AAA family protein n=1 Tax=Cardiosporidium cionae TaxID=476202 RepID=A0ABQ7JE80_9APIC|nr:ATPase, AAA family protein [Cardiosporidium cionae]|eukprot:KAF8822322.1 ATPase, AAA family protein [Cardiosporidium cionae]
MTFPFIPPSPYSPHFCGKSPHFHFPPVSPFSEPLTQSLSALSHSGVASPLSIADPRRFFTSSPSFSLKLVSEGDANPAVSTETSPLPFFSLESDSPVSSPPTDAISAVEELDSHYSSSPPSQPPPPPSNFNPLPFSWKNFWYTVAYLGGVSCLTLYLLRRFFRHHWLFSQTVSQFQETSFSHFKEFLENSKIQALTYCGETFVYYTDREGLHYLTYLVPGSKKYIFQKALETAIPTLQSLPEETFVTASYPTSFFQHICAFFVDLRRSFYPLQLAVSLGGLFLFFTNFLGLSYFSDKNSDMVKFQTKGKSKKSINFADVIGMEKVKEEFRQIIDFVGSPEKIQKLGVRLPRGILLEGPSGTGKTLMARALAGEAGLPFCSVSASQFIEMYVGQGAARIRNVFSNARSKAPCILFIDELDAIGIDRATVGKASQEYVQTLNQLLIELDGMETNLAEEEEEGREFMPDFFWPFSQSSSSGSVNSCSSNNTYNFPPFVLVVAATNRMEALDEALIRPGRFDRLIHINLPSVDEREALFLLHTRRKSLGKDVLLKEFAAASEGFSGADIEGLLNEAALLAAREGTLSLQRHHILEILKEMKTRKESFQPAEDASLQPFTMKDFFTAFERQTGHISTL